MTSTDGDYGQTSNNTNNNSINITSGNQPTGYNRRINSNSTNPYSSSNGIEIRILMTSRDAGAVIGRNDWRSSRWMIDNRLFRQRWFSNSKTS